MAMADKASVIRTVEMHTGGEPLRIIVSGYPPLLGGTILERRRYVLANHDHLRRMLMAEPRGHTDMYGAILLDTESLDEGEREVDLAVLFIHNEGYSTMCGHGVIALGRYAIDYKLVKPVSPVTQVRMLCPCGLVKAEVEYDDKTGKTGQTRFESVPAFAFSVNETVTIDGYGTITYDIGYGGAFYALVDVRQFKMDISHTPVHRLVDAADTVSSVLRKSLKLEHPESADLAFLYGTILTDGKDVYPSAGEEPTANLTIFADKQVDRSPCGSGVTARVAVQYHKKQIQLGQRRTFLNGKTNSAMTAKPLKVVPYGCYDNAVVVEVSGRGHYIGESSFWLDEGDELGAGFLVE